MMQDQSKPILESKALQVHHMNEISAKSFQIIEQQTEVIDELIIKVDTLANSKGTL